MPHQPVCRIIPRADTAVLFVHGIIGTPNHFLPLLPIVPEHVSIRSILLDGHGGDVRAFSRSRLSIWRKQAEDTALRLITAFFEGTLLQDEQLQLDFATGTKVEEQI